MACRKRRELLACSVFSQWMEKNSRKEKKTKERTIEKVIRKKKITYLSDPPLSQSRSCRSAPLSKKILRVARARRFDDVFRTRITARTLGPMYLEAECAAGQNCAVEGFTGVRCSLRLSLMCSPLRKAAFSSLRAASGLTLLL